VLLLVRPLIHFFALMLWVAAALAFVGGMRAGSRWRGLPARSEPDRRPWPGRARRSRMASPAPQAGHRTDRNELEEDPVTESKKWHVTITIDEHDGHTRALARLVTRDSERLTGVGLARLNPADHDVPEIGDELAVGRALVDLGTALLGVAVADVDENTPGQDARI
jgi:Domain of unknown function (DUF1876)